MLFGKLFTNPKMWVNGNADEITMGGVYTCKDVQNVPTGDGALLVFKTENTVKQVFVPVGEEGVVYTRVLGEDWSSVSGTSEETEALIQSAIDKANQAQAKADTVDTRLNNIIVESGTSDAEVVAARTDSSGQTFTTLGQRLDTQFGEIKEDLILSTGLEKIELQKNTCTNLQNPLTQVAYNGFSSAVIPCVPDEHFQIKGIGGNGSRLWIFADSDGTSIRYASANTDQSSDFIELTAPNNAAYLSVNNDDAKTEMHLYRGSFLADDVKKLGTVVETKPSFLGKNMVGSEMGVYYPVDKYDLYSGQTLTVSTSDGNAFGTDLYGLQINLIFSNESHKQLAYWGLQIGNTSRTITLNESAAMAKYVCLSGTPRVPIQVENGSTKTAYEPYFPPVDDLAKYTISKSADVNAIHLGARNKVNVIKKHATSDGLVENTLKLLWASDIHNERQRFVRMVELMNAWGDDYLDAAINTGDTVATLQTQGLAWYNTLASESTIPVLTCVGNHDAYATLAPATLVDKVDVYNMVIAPVAAQTVIVQPSNAATLGLNYYYKDVNGIRIVVLDCMYWTTEQEAWFANALSDAVSNSLPVIAVSHAPFAQQYSELLNTIWNGSSFVRDSTLMNYAAAQCVDTFISNGGTFLCWMQGHIHGDEIYKLPSNNNQLCICVDGFGPRGTQLIKNTEIASYNYDCLTFLTVDTVNSLIKLYRIGANIDRNGRKHNMFTWNYAEKSIVSEW